VSDVRPLVLACATLVISVPVGVRARRVRRTPVLRVEGVLQRRRVYATLVITVEMEVRAPRARCRTRALHAVAYIQDLEQ
jgi:hypothetical protein